MPAMVSSECYTDKENASKVVGRKQTYFCLWGQTLPSVIWSNQKFKSYQDRFIMPKIELREGDAFVINDLLDELNKNFSWFKREDVEKAYNTAKAEQQHFRASLFQLYNTALKEIEANDREGLF
jgi:predicted nucleotide-binding protein (sugar kinase/HSP70/actin superfamily)